MIDVSNYRLFERADNGLVDRYIVYSAWGQRGFVIFPKNEDGFLCPLTGEWIDLASIERVDKLEGRYTEHVVACQPMSTSHYAMGAYLELAKTMSKQGNQNGVDVALMAYAGQQQRHLVHSEDFAWARDNLRELRTSLAVA